MFLLNDQNRPTVFQYTSTLNFYDIHNPFYHKTSCLNLHLKQNISIFGPELGSSSLNFDRSSIESTQKSLKKFKKSKIFDENEKTLIHNEKETLQRNFQSQRTSYNKKVGFSKNNREETRKYKSPSHLIRSSSPIFVPFNKKTPLDLESSLINGFNKDYRRREKSKNDAKIRKFDVDSKKNSYTANLYENSPLYMKMQENETKTQRIYQESSSNLEEGNNRNIPFFKKYQNFEENEDNSEFFKESSSAKKLPRSFENNGNFMKKQKEKNEKKIGKESPLMKKSKLEKNYQDFEEEKPHKNHLFSKSLDESPNFLEKKLSERDFFKKESRFKEFEENEILEKKQEKSKKSLFLEENSKLSKRNLSISPQIQKNKHSVFEELEKTKSEFQKTPVNNFIFFKHFFKKNIKKKTGLENEEKTDKSLVIFYILCLLCIPLLICMYLKFFK